MNLLCIDPGTEISGVVVLDTETLEVSGIESGIDNNELIKRIPFMQTCDHMAFEMVAGMGMTVGQSTFETILWMGRFIQEFNSDHCDRIYRRDVKLALCGDSRAKDANIRQAILDLYKPTGGGATPEIGIKKKPGPLYGMSKHAWSALAVGLTWHIEKHWE